MPDIHKLRHISCIRYLDHRAVREMNREPVKRHGDMSTFDIDQGPQPSPITDPFPRINPNRILNFRLADSERTPYLYDPSSTDKANIGKLDL